MGNFKKLAVVLLTALAAAAVARCEDYATQAIGPFGNLNNTDSSFVIPADKAQDLLNVDISPNGKSVKKRKGFSLFSNLSITTSAVHGVYNFYDSNGNDVSLFFNDAYMTASVAGGSATTLFSNGPNGATYQCVDSQGFAYCANTSRTTIIKTNGATYSTLAPVATGYLIAVTPDRLVTAGSASSQFPNRIDFSKANDFTIWVVGSQPTDPVNFTITAPGSRITHITYAFNRLMWFKDSSFGYILSGPTLSDWQVRTVSPNIGTLDNSSVYWDNLLYFRGQDAHFYAFDGSNLQKLSRDIQATVNVSQPRRTNAWTQTNVEDWQAGRVAPTNFLSTTSISGSVTTLTSNVTSYFHDVSQADFQLGTSSNVTVNAAGTVSLATSTIITAKDSCTSATEAPASQNDGGNGHGRSFTSTSTYTMAAVSFNACVLTTGGGTVPEPIYLSVYSDSSFSPGTLLATATGTVSANCATTSEDATGYFQTPVSISSGTRYWIRAQADSANHLQYRGNTTSGCGSSEKHTPLVGGWGSTPVTPGQFRFSTFAVGHSTSGTFLSRSFDIGFTTNTWVWTWNPILWVSTDNAETLTFQTQTSSDGSSWDALTSVSAGQSPTSTVRRYIRYKATFLTSNIETTPVLDDVSLSLSPSTFFSQVKNASALTSWDTFQVTKQDNGGSISFYIRSATGAFSVMSSTPAWTAIIAGAVPSISTGTYFQIRADFIATSSTQTPQLNDFTQNWFEGGATDKAYATYHRDAIWWAITSGAGSTTNNKIARFDLLTSGWGLYDIPMNGMLVRNQSLYFGSASTGKVYKFGDTDNDDGAAINAYWKSKDFFGDNPFTDKEINQLSLIGTSIVNSSMTVTYTLNASSATAYTVPLYSTTSNFLRSNKNLPLGRVGNTINVKFGNNAADQPFEIYAVQFGFRPKPWNTQ